MAYYTQLNAIDIGVDSWLHYEFYQRNLLPQVDEAIEPPRLVRQSNKWTLFYGSYPRYCANLTVSKVVENILRSPVYVSHCIFVEPVFATKTLTMRHNVIAFVLRIQHQLQIFAEATLLTYVKEEGMFQVIFSDTGEKVELRVYVTHDKKEIQLIILKNNTVPHTDKNLNSFNATNLIRCLEHVMRDLTTPLYSTFPAINLAREYIEPRGEILQNVEFRVAFGNIPFGEPTPVIGERMREFKSLQE
jgi:hypothetical protein